MLLEVELAQKLLGAQEAEEQSQPDASAQAINNANIAENNADGSADTADNNVTEVAQADNETNGTANTTETENN